MPEGIETMSVDIYKIISSLKQRLQELQRSDERTKKRYLIVGSVAVMVMVIGLWVVYLNVSLSRGDEEVALVAHDETLLDEEGEDSDSFIKVLGRGSKDIIQNLKEQFGQVTGSVSRMLSSFSANLSRANEFSFEGSRAKFVFEERDPIPPTPLP